MLPHDLALALGCFHASALPTTHLLVGAIVGIKSNSQRTNGHGL